MVEISDFPAMCVMSVPIAKAIGKPSTFNPGVTIQAPPCPKKPPIIPTPRPRITRPGHQMWTPAMGMNTYNQFIFDSLNPPLGFPQLSRLQVNADAAHEQIGQAAQDNSRQRDDQHREQSKIQMA